MQTPPQRIWPTGQMHLPAVQLVPAPHLTPQAPQLFASVLTSVHAPPQDVRPVPQVATHLPAEQLCVAEQTVPQAPQFFGSLVTSTHAPPHAIVPVGHVQVPPTQD